MERQPPPGGEGSPTLRGLAWLARAASCGRVFGGVLLLTGLLGVLVLSAPRAGLVGYLLVWAPLAIIAVVFAATGLVALLIGFAAVGAGRAEFGPEHARRVMGGRGLLVAAAVSEFLSITLGAISMIGAAGAVGADPAAEAPGLAAGSASSFLAGGVFAFAAVVLLVAALLQIVRELAPRGRSGHAPWFAGLMVACACASLFVSGAAATLTPSASASVALLLVSPLLTLPAILGHQQCSHLLDEAHAAAVERLRASPRPPAPPPPPKRGPQPQG